MIERVWVERKQYVLEEKEEIEEKKTMTFLLRPKQYAAAGVYLQIHFAHCAHLSLWYFFFYPPHRHRRRLLFPFIFSLFLLLLYFIFFNFLFLLSHRIYCMTDVENVFWVFCLVHKRARSLIVIAYFVAVKKYTYYTREKKNHTGIGCAFDCIMSCQKSMC